jgi:acetyl-CoA acetyltransferase
MSALCSAAIAAIEDAGVSRRDVDGLAVTSVTLAPDRVGDLAFQLGLQLRFMQESPPMGAGPIANIARAMRSIEAGDASIVVVVAGDAHDWSSGAPHSAMYNRIRGEYLNPLGYSGPNSLFALLTQHQARTLGLSTRDYGQIPVSQRAWAAGNPVAVYREPLSIEHYLEARLVADPLRTVDCVPRAAGANAVVLGDLARTPTGRRPVWIRAIGERYNHDNQLGDGLNTGLAQIGIFERAGVEPADIDVVSLYDDYPAVVIAQLLDLGFTDAAGIRDFLHDRIATHAFPLNTSGGMLSAGQAGASGGLLGTVEIVRQLQHRAEGRQLDSADLGLATGYGHVVYRYGLSATALILEGAA